MEVARGGRVTYGQVFFRWFHGQLMMGEYYSYARTNFRGYANVTLPEDDHWDDRCKKYGTLVVILFYNIQCLNIEKKLPIFYRKFSINADKYFVPNLHG